MTYADMRIQNFVAACQRRWPGAEHVRTTISIAPQGARALADLQLAPNQEDIMSDSFNFGTPTEADLDSAYGSRFLSAADLGNERKRAKIARVSLEAVKGNDGREKKRIVLHLNGLDKPAILNATNKNTMVGALGRNPAKWIGADIGLYTEPTQFAGRPTVGLRLRVLNNPIGGTSAAPQQKPTPKPTPAPATEAAARWPEEAGDPGNWGEAAE
jgi:hypothetical protein